MLRSSIRGTPTPIATPMPANGRSCETCTYFAPASDECRRSAPKHGTSTPTWPKVTPKSWCGEWQTDVPYADAAPYESMAAVPTVLLP